jgi:hypothetical protein
MPRKCRKCNKQPSFNYEGKPPEYCKDHMKKGMKNVKHKKCKECSKQPTYNFIGKPPEYCKDHMKDGMEDVFNKKCNECSKQPTYNFIGKPPEYCKDHMKDGMENVTSKRCNECNKQPCFNYDGLFAEYCKDHMKDGMENVTNKRCNECNKCASCNYEGLSAEYCGDHKKEGMENVTCKRCKECNKCASFNYEGLIAEYCFDHKKEEMEDVVSKKCIECYKRPSYNYKGLTPEYCFDHQKYGMEDVKHKKCIECNITTANSKYKDHCLYCYINKFPDEPISRNYKVKENYIFDALFESLNNNEMLKNIIRDKKINNGCSLRRPDLQYDCLTHWICIENDENEHKNYDTTCENKRMMELHQDMGHRPMVLIRFNCDSYMDKECRYPSLFKIHKLNGCVIINDKQAFDERIKILKDKFLSAINIIPEKELTIEYLFYSES